MDTERLNAEIKKLNESKTIDLANVLGVNDPILINSREELVDFVQTHLEELSVEDLTNLLEDYQIKFNFGNVLFPSNWNYGPYPVKLAEALSKSQDNEDITDIYNVYYQNKNEADWKDAIKVLQDSILSDLDAYYRDMELLLDLDGDMQYVVELYDEIQDHYPEFVNKLLEKHKEKNDGIAEAMDDALDV